MKRFTASGSMEWKIWRPPLAIFKARKRFESCLWEHKLQRWLLPTEISRCWRHDSNAAISFFTTRGAEVLWHWATAVAAGLAIGGAKFFLARVTQYERAAPVLRDSTVRIELFVDDPIATQRRAVATGATGVRWKNTLTRQRAQPIKRMLQARL
jgi:hypothetical protein